MYIALATFGDKIAALFESSEKFLIVDSASHKLDNIKTIPLRNNSPNELLNLLKQNNVNVLICGAMSGCIRRLIEAQNIQVIPWITGNVNQVFDAFQSNRIFSSSFIMPGCGKIRGRLRYQFGRRKGNY